MQTGHTAPLAEWAPRVLSVLRIVAAILFLEHGTQKLFGLPPPVMQQPAAFTLLWLAAVMELAGGALLAIGLLSRPVAFLLCFLFLYLVFAGPGPWSLDAAMRRD